VEIQRDIAEKRLFVVDASALGQINCQNCDYAPILILRMDSSNNLLPVSIQTSREKDALIFTPEDKVNGFEWEFAKRIFEGVNSLEQTLINHLLTSHLAVEVVAFAAYKTRVSRRT